MPDNDQNTWAVRWEAAQLPVGLTPECPPPPVYPADQLPPVTYDPATGNPIPPEYTPEQQQLIDDYQAQAEVYAECVAEWNAAVDTALGDDANWTVVMSTASTESVARALLAELRLAHAGDKYTRNFRLVTAPPRNWTVVE
ncbi:hypothetical protein PQB71_gp27 [Mycobacterium phage Taptic]|uniref:Uncharacterized protein n=1 Tax=Mycobacterium phage Taptic TaxID=1920305 RepID=A0A1J0MDT7_9CAUD|nr:hypothetical protein PQB71_gp27 [Mycobacterium phage Taptic]APD19257.1 hypothetical protein SEA_TAPTIC_27 [Mycobacterium phage Taptic]